MNEQPLGSPGYPGYWMHETSGILRPVVEAYLHGAELDAQQCATMRAYLRQWIHAGFLGPEVAELRADLDTLTTRQAIAAWIERAADAGCDPL